MTTQSGRVGPGTAATRVPICSRERTFEEAVGVICPNCGSENRAGRKFCGGCAAPLAAICASCGSVNEPDMRFCGECAAPLAATRAVSPATTGTATTGPGPTGSTGPPPAPVAERRLVSVLFADLVGFTPFAAERDAEDVRETLGRYFELATDIVVRYGGTIEKFIGDAVMAVWGAPTAHEDDAERAVRAGLELVDVVRALGPTIQARAGVLTGEAAVTIGATNQGMVAGDLVNTAARLQSVAPPGAVLVGETTHRAASRAIVFEAVGEQTLKGKQAPVPAWRALRVVAELRGRNRSESLEAPFVGREHELRLLKDLFHATGREQRIRLVSVIGPAGIGKSRLAWEFSKYTDGLVEPTYWHAGRSPAYGDGISFWALGEMVRGRCGLIETDEEPTTRAKVAATLTEYVADAEERRWIESALLDLLGIGSGSGSEQLFGAWRTFFVRIAGRGPVTMVFEDHHFADPGLLDFVDHMLEWSRGLPIFIVTLARPELLEKRPDWGAGKRSFTSIYLEPLPEPAMRQLLAGLVPGLPAPAVAAIVERADGIPLYAVETVRMLLAEGRLREDGGAYVPVGDLTSLAVPESLTALIASRLDGLPAGDRALVSDAAVLGQSFTLAGLSAVSGVATDELEPRLRALVHRELFTLELDPRSPERGQFAFVQALIREVAYNTLAKKDRKVRHLAAARYFESLETDELAGALASQYRAAHDNAPEGPEAEALAGQARLALRGAAGRAAALGSPDQALSYLRQIEAITVDRSLLVETWEAAGVAAEDAGRLDVAKRYFEQAVAERRAGTDRSATAAAIAALGRVKITDREVSAALELLGAASAEFPPEEGSHGAVELATELARSHMRSGHDEPAIAIADRALAIAEPAELTELIAEGLTTKGVSLGSLGRAQEGLALLRGAVAIAERHGLVRAGLRARQNLWFSDLDDPAGAVEVIRLGLDLARRLGLREWTLDLTLVVSFGQLIITADWDGAIAAIAPVEESEPDPTYVVLFSATRAFLEAMRGSPEAATVTFTDLRRRMPSGGDPQTHFNLALWSGWADLAAGRAEEALLAADVVRRSDWGSSWRTWGSALGVKAAIWSRDPAAIAASEAPLAGATGRWPNALRLELRAAVSALGGEPAESTALYREALDRWRDLDMPFQFATAVIGACRVLGPRPELTDALAEARSILSGLGARSLLERLDEASRGDVARLPSASA